MEACEVVQANPNTLDSYMGHKGRPLNASLPNFDWQTQIVSDISHNVSNVCKMFLRVLVGKGDGAFYSSWGNKDKMHRIECELLGVFPSVWTSVGGDLPWRLSAMDLQQAERRSMSLVYPHYTEVVSIGGKSYWTKPSAMWKMSHKNMILLVLLPTCLRGIVTRVHKAICHLAEASRLLLGQVFSFNRARELRVPTGSFSGTTCILLLVIISF